MKFILVMATLSLPFRAISQNISFKNMLYSINKSGQNVSQMFKSNGIIAVPLDLDQNLEDKCKSSDWVFTDSLGKSQLGYYTVGCTSKDNMKYCKFQTPSPAKFNRLISECKTAKFLFNKKEKVGSEIWESYYNAPYTVTFIEDYSAKNPVSKYKILLFYLPQFDVR